MGKIRVFAACVCIFFTISAQKSFADESYTLKLHHYSPPNGVEHQRFFLPWAEALKEESGGRIDMKVYPGMMLGGSVKQLLDQVKNGIADIVLTVPGWNPGSVPRLEVFELPFVHKGNLLATNMAIRSMIDTYLIEDFDDKVHPLFIFVHYGSSFHCGEGTRIETVEDFRGKRIGTAHRSGTTALEALGASPIHTTIPHIRQAMIGGILDCTLLPFTALKIGSLQRGVMRHQTFIGYEGRKIGMGTTAIGIFMNKAVYRSMPPDLQGLIDKYTGSNLVASWSKFYHKEEEVMIQDQKGQGSEIIIMPEEEGKKMEEILQVVTDEWIENARESGVDNPEELLEEALYRIEKFSAMYPLGGPDDYMNLDSPFPKRY